MDTSNVIKMHSQPQVGYYELEAGFRLYLAHKPSWVKRFFCRACLGFTWRDL